MENNFYGDLADIFRPGYVSSIDPPGIVSDWQYFDQPDHESQMIQKSTIIEDHDEGFRQPCFTNLLLDPLINHEGTSSTPCYFGTTTSLDNDQQKSTTTTRSIPLGFDQNNGNIFSKMVQILPNVANSTDHTTTSNYEMVTCSSNSSSAPKRGLQEASTSTTLQISSPRNPAIKRRKSQAKKVVHIPAPAPANSRSTGEVVPSDLWAWRKYGQKPIKGSPYPRGYYRCSSSKGCSARKQVERSRTDPNMLVITYTSEHNHPWPTQRNALAGSTRTPQPPKTEPQTQQQTTTEDEGSTIVLGQLNAQVKNELQVLDASIPQGYRPELPGRGGGGNEQTSDFFLGLGEIEGDPISILLNQGFLNGDEEAENYNKDLDPFG
ncbi:uncharacterized protein [Rutidosis leptorrhynchoides]|uniref:uncharacterized protein n=1 Tax=Rutidosis leptorrhynchoides TaxID=125765 RepID=UPI003A999519